MAARKQSGRGPTKLDITTYQVGFGDCFLLSWHYATGTKHLLIDFGSNGGPKNAPPNLLKRVADDIATTCGGKLDAVVLTHRHKDHMSGFATAANKKGPGDVIAQLRPDVVVQPWTEDPRALRKAPTATRTISTSRAFANSLANMQHVSAGIAVEAARLASTEPLQRKLPLFRRLQFAGEEGIKNPSAVRNLQTMAKKHAYVNHGSKSGLEPLLPGVKITVLGPPTLKQSDSIRKERRADQTEFWMFQGKSGLHAAATPGRLFTRAGVIKGAAPPPYARWFVPRVRDMRAEGMQQIVRVLDDAMNNTSVILLFEVAGQSFLFPGDAQIENWEFTLGSKALMQRLRNVTFYKVGHHGSRNATPKTLWTRFVHAGPKGKTKKPRLQTVVSTMADKFGKTEGAEVPRKTLIAALQAGSTFFSTQALKGKKIKETFAFPFKGETKSP